jgi:3'(2'), 5'-bisphosphate nucleotidase
MDIKIDIEVIKSIAKKAGELILKVYNKSFEDSIGYKTDRSPLTVADQISHDHIIDELRKLMPEIPIISEEGKDISYEERKEWPVFWLIDPLDGTKEFIKRNDQFTVNIALVEGNKPIFGLIYPPCLGRIYYTHNSKAYVEDREGNIEEIKVNNKKEKLIAVRSRSHAAPEEVELFRKYKVSDYVSKGSALKFCMIAEGEADIYYRFKPTMEWDTAAGQAIVEAAGGKVFDGLTDKPFTYNKPSLVNGSFLCTGF